VRPLCSLRLRVSIVREYRPPTASDHRRAAGGGGYGGGGGAASNGGGGAGAAGAEWEHDFSSSAAAAAPSVSAGFVIVHEVLSGGPLLRLLVEVPHRFLLLSRPPAGRRLLLRGQPA